MKSANWMAFYVGDYAKNTLKLTTRQHGAYLLLILACWQEGGSVDGDDDTLASITKLSMPDWLQWFAEHNPITTFVDAIRVLFIDAHADNAVWLSFVWVVVITLVFGMLSVWRFRRALSR